MDLLFQLIAYGVGFFCAQIFFRGKGEKTGTGSVLSQAFQVLRPSGIIVIDQTGVTGGALDHIKAGQRAFLGMKTIGDILLIRTLDLGQAQGFHGLQQPIFQIGEGEHSLFRLGKGLCF